MSEPLLPQQFFVLTATILSREPWLVASLDPRQVLICASTIRLLRRKPGMREFHKHLDRLVETLVRHGARILHSRSKARTSGLNPLSLYSRTLDSLDTLPELNEHATPQGASARRFYVLTYNSNSEQLNDLHFLNRENSIALRRYIKTPENDEIYQTAINYCKLVTVKKRITLIKMTFSFLSSAAIFIITWYFLGELLYSFASRPEARTIYSTTILSVAVLLSGAFVFAWRERYRLSYGLFEIMIGTATTQNVFGGGPAMTSMSDASSYLQLAAGVYVMVRGFDNVGKAVIGTQSEWIWRRIFEGRKVFADDPDVPKYLRAPASDQSQDSVEMNASRMT